MKSQLQEFLTRVKEEIELIKNTIPNAGFIERVCSRLLVLLETNPLSSGIYKKWKDSIGKDEKAIDLLAKNGCRELTKAFKALWEDLVSSPKKEKHCPISFTINGINPDKFLEDLMETVCQGSACCYVEPPLKIAYDRLKNMYCERIARCYELTFAPNANQFLVKTSQRELMARAERIPYVPLEHFLRLRNAWEMRTIDRLRVGFGPVRGDEDTRLYRAHIADSQARFNYFVEDLKRCEAHDGCPQLFDRQFYHQELDKLFFELKIAILEQPLQSVSYLEDDHAHTKKYREDLEILIPLAEEAMDFYKNLGAKATIPKLTKIVNDLIDARDVKIHDPNKTRIEEAIRQARAFSKGKHREITTRKKPGTPKSRKPVPKKTAQK